jgi:hypothetical protein
MTATAITAQGGFVTAIARWKQQKERLIALIDVYLDTNSRLIEQSTSFFSLGRSSNVQKERLLLLLQN